MNIVSQLYLDCEVGVMKWRRLKEVCDRFSINKRPSNNVTVLRERGIRFSRSGYSPILLLLAKQAFKRKGMKEMVR